MFRYFRVFIVASTFSHFRSTRLPSQSEKQRGGRERKRTDFVFMLSLSHLYHKPSYTCTLAYIPLLRRHNGVLHQNILCYSGSVKMTKRRRTKSRFTLADTSTERKSDKSLEKAHSTHTHLSAHSSRKHSPSHPLPKMSHHFHLLKVTKGKFAFP